MIRRSLAIAYIIRHIMASSALSGSTGQMRYVDYKHGGPENLVIRTRPIPQLTDSHVLLKVYATAVNRADTLQRKGLYPPPPGESDIIGLEATGEVEKLGPGCSGQWTVGDRVMALLAGGGYAEYLSVHEDLLMPVPHGMSFTQAAAIPEVWLTAYQLIFFTGGGVDPDDYILVHAGGSGVGTALVQLLKGHKTMVTAGSAEKIQKAKRLGAVVGFNYKEENFADKVLEFTEGHGADMILDCIGQSFYENNINCIASEGRWVLYGLMGGGNVNGDILSRLLWKRVTLTATTLRTRSIRYKKAVIDGFRKDALPLFESGEYQPIIDTVLPLESVVDAHKMMEANKNSGKIILTVRDESQAGTKDKSEL